MSMVRMPYIHQLVRPVFRTKMPCVSSAGPAGVVQHQCRIHTSAVYALKKINQREESGITIIEGIFGKSPHEDYLIKPFASLTETEARQCSLCRMGIHNVRHTDVLVISQFMDRHGEILPRQITGLCAQQYRRVSISLYQAQRVGLIQNKRHTPKERWQELNNYFGKTRTKVDFGKPKINIWDFLKKPSEKKFWEA